MSGRYLLSAATLLAAGTMLTAFAFAQSATSGPAFEPAALAQSPGALGNPIFINLQGPTSTRAAATSALLKKTASQGASRVIVGLKRTLKSPDDLSPADAASQTSALRAAQNAVASRVIGSGSSEAAGVSTFDYIPFLSLNVNASQLDRLVADPDVANIQEDVAVAPSLTQSVPFINSDDVATAGFPGTGIVVAILDTGVDNVHTMFPGAKIASQACYSSNVPASGATTVCPGGVLSSTAAGSGVNCALSISGCDHGTHVAGIAAGNSASPLLRGVARNSRIIAIQVFSRFASCAPNPSPCPKSFTSDQIKGLERVYALRNSFVIASVNMSLGGGQFAAPCDASNVAQTAIIRLLRDAKIATVIASGNNGFNGSMGAPACISEAISVGSTLDNANTLSDFSNHTDLVRLLAPGSSITSSIPDATNPQNATGDKNGTSMATPHVAGAFAQLRDVRAGSTVDDIAAALECTGVNVTRAGITERRIDVAAARAYLLAPPAATKAFSFSVVTQATQWTPHTGTWSIAGGRYNLTQLTAGWKASTTANCNESETITAVLRRAWPATSRSSAGIMFKTQYSQVSASDKRVSGYFVFLSRDLPGDDHTTNLTLWRFDRLNLVTNLTFGQQMLCNKDIDTITSGTMHTIKVITNGGRHRVFLNNVQHCDVTERSYGTGRAGVITYIGTAGASNAFNIESFVIDPTEVVPPASAPGIAAVN